MHKLLMAGRQCFKSAEDGPRQQL